MDAELRSIYERCDVSNNGTDDPLSFEEFKQWHQQEIAKARIDELKPVAFRVKDALKASSGPSVVVRTHLTDEFIDKRIAELTKLKEHKE